MVDSHDEGSELTRLPSVLAIAAEQVIDEPRQHPRDLLGVLPQPISHLRRYVAPQLGNHQVCAYLGTGSPGNAEIPCERSIGALGKSFRQVCQQGVGAGVDLVAEPEIL